MLFWCGWQPMVGSEEVRRSQDKSCVEYRDKETGLITRAYHNGEEVPELVGTLPEVEARECSVCAAKYALEKAELMVEVFSEDESDAQDESADS